MNKQILALALNNAIKYEGKANLNAVIGAAFSEFKNKDKLIVIKEVKEIIKEVNSWNIEKQKQELKKLKFKTKKRKERVGLPKLENTRNLVMRFEPSPSGPLHIGHALVLLLNSEYCKRYRGKLILRISDTNPENIDLEAYKLIPEDARWITNNKISKVIIQSDRLKIYYKYAEQLIKKQGAYVCTCKNFKFYADNRAECPCRNLDIKENLKRWKLMFKKQKGYAALRIKTDILHKNPAMRDWPAFRINKHKHPRQKDKHQVWPLMNFAVAIDDHLLKVTHAIRAKDHMVNTERQAYLYKHFNWKPPMALHVGRINFKDFKVSSTETRKLIKKKKYTGWDDIRLPFLQAFKRRGLNPEAFAKQFIEIGLSPVDKLVSYHEFMNKIYAFNRDIIDKKTNRYFFVWNPKKIKIKNAPNLTVKAPLHPDNKKAGSRTFKTKDQFYICDELNKYTTYRFMHLFNFKDKTYTSTDYKPDLNAKLIHWLPAENNIKVEILNDDGKITKGLAESTIKNLKIGDIIQFERFGFVKLDKKNKFWWLHR